MKVIRASIEVASWKIQKECTECKSLLELCCKDIAYDLRYGRQESNWRATCCLCGHGIFFKESELPKLVQVDIIKHRYLTTSGCDK